MSNVNNGRRVQVVHALYAGSAGLVEDDGQILVSFPLKTRSVIDGPISIDGEPYRIDTARRSQITSGMVVVSVSAVTDGAA